MRPLPEGYRLRAATPGDIDALGEIEAASNTLFKGTGLLDAAPPGTIPSEILKDAVAAGCVTVAEHETDGPVGFTLVSLRPPDLYLDEVSVHPDHGRKGVGRALVEAVIETARRGKVASVSLSTFRDVPWNGPFYASLGFREIPRAKLEPWMRSLEAAQAETLDVSRRCFMRRKARRGLLAFPR